MLRRLAPLLALPPLALGAAAAAWMIASAPGPAEEEGAPPGLAVRVATLAAGPVRPVARGWGNVRAAESWVAVAEVRGQVIRRHPDLAAGRLVAAGTTVLEIDPADYDLAIAQAEADLGALAAEAAQIAAEAENTARVLALEEARLALAEADLARIRDLVAQGASPRTRADEAERAALAARRTVVELQNALALIPSRQARNAAQAARTEAALARARRDREHTAIVAPFDLRVTTVGAERFQYVNVGQVLAGGDGVAAVEVVVHVPVVAFQRLLSPFAPTDLLAALRAGPEQLIAAELRPVAAPDQVWPATPLRVEGTLDPRARTVQVVVGVEGPYAAAAPPLRIPLVPNTQVEVTLTGPPVADALLIPEAALHGRLAYVAGADDRLELREVTAAFRQDGAVVVAAGLAAGDRLVLDDIAPALPGLALRPVEAAP